MSSEEDQTPAESATASAAVAQDIDGKSIAASIREGLKGRVEALTAETGIRPGLAVVLVGSRRDSQTYVRMKKKACAECGIESFGHDFDESVTQEALLDCVRALNADPAVHGILVQLPLPKHIEESTILNAIDPAKDVDGLHPLNVAHLASTSTHLDSQTKLDWSNLNDIPFPIACTPSGCIELLDQMGLNLRGKRAAVVGRSNLVGMPVAMLLLHRDATVTIVHSKTPDPHQVVSEADIVVVAVGRPRLVEAHWIRPGAVVIDVGINSVDDDTTKKGYRLVGDVDYEGCRRVASFITPVPGGVGPMTIAMLLRNTVNACRRSLKVVSQDSSS